MLKALTIEDLAVVRQLDIEFQPGLTVLTGETGAGKSILVEALGLTLGDRADTSMIRAGADKASVTATFDLTGNTAALCALAEHELDNGTECILRRVVSGDGRSRAFCNATPIPVQTLHGIGELLVDIHGQHAHQSLLRSDVQRAIIDEFGGLSALAGRTREAYECWKIARDEREKLAAGDGDMTNRRELLHYQLEELEAASPSAGEFDILLAEHRRLSHAQQLIEGAESIARTVFDGDDSVLAGLSSAQSALRKLADLDGELNALLALVEQAALNLDEARREIRRFKDSLEVDDSRLDEVETRLNLLHELSRKHHCEPGALHPVLERLRTELETLDRGDARIAELDAVIARSLQEFDQAALALHHERSAAAIKLGGEISRRMRDLAMPHAEFVAVVEKRAESAPVSNGLDQIDFLVSTNPDQPPRLLRKVASGGELSRISLAIQTATAGVSGVPVVVYDEVDSGVGGRVADTVSRNLRNLAAKRQVLCITHLPQIASRGDHHLLIAKTLADGVTETLIQVLAPEERVEELARMLGGLDVSDNARAHARELLERSAA